MTTIDETTHPVPPDMPDGLWLIGATAGCWHAVARDTMLAAYRRHGARRPLPAGCGDYVDAVNFAWGEFRRGNNRILTRTGAVCSRCTWTVAAGTGRLDDEVTALIPTGRDATVLRRLLTRPTVAADVARAIAARHHAELDPEDPDTDVLRLLAAVTDHAPTLFVPLDCLYGDCDHDRDDDPHIEVAGQETLPGMPPPDPDPPHPDDSRCLYPEATVACPACSVCLGSSAGEAEGHAMVTVRGLCSVLLAIAAKYDVPAGTRITNDAVDDGADRSAQPLAGATHT